MSILGLVLLIVLFLMIVGGLSGFFVVPMNALLQHRGHVLLSAGHSIAVQNFNENLSILIMLAIYSVLIRYSVPINLIIVMFGFFITGSMVVVIRRHVSNQAQGDSLHLIGIDKH